MSESAKEVLRRHILAAARVATDLDEIIGAVLSAMEDYAAALQAENERLRAREGEFNEHASKLILRAERAESDLAALTAENAELRAEVTKWQRIRTPTHGPCCTCQKCGQHYDDCRCDLDEVVDELELTKTDLAALTAKMERAEKVIEAAHRFHHRFCDGADDHEQAVRWRDLDQALVAYGLPAALRDWRGE